MTKPPNSLDAITDVVLAYRPAGTGENAAAIARKMARKSIKSTCPQSGMRNAAYDLCVEAIAKATGKAQ